MNINHCHKDPFVTKFVIHTMLEIGNKYHLLHRSTNLYFTLHHKSNHIPILYNQNTIGILTNMIIYKNHKNPRATMSISFFDKVQKVSMLL